MNDVAPINTLADRVPGIGHNNPPLVEQLAEEMAIVRARAEELLEVAREAQITNDDEAGKVATLIALIRDHETSVDRARRDRKQPFLDASRIIDATYGAVIRPLCLARSGENGKGGLSGILTAWQQQCDQEGSGDPVRSQVASVGKKREVEFEITDLGKALRWLAKNRTGEIGQAARTIIGTHIRSMGVEAAPSANIPGVNIKITIHATVR